MLKKFRRIRLKFLSKGKLKRYLIYAIVEILLIVIGILLALSLNTRQNNKKNSAIERDYISDIIIDIRQDTSYFNDRRIKNIKKKTEFELVRNQNCPNKFTLQLLQL